MCIMLIFILCLYIYKWYFIYLFIYLFFFERMNFFSPILVNVIQLKIKIIDSPVHSFEVSSKPKVQNH